MICYCVVSSLVLCVLRCVVSKKFPPAEAEAAAAAGLRQGMASDSVCVCV